METNRPIPGTINVTTEQLIESVKENPELYNQLLRNRYTLIDKNILLLYPGVNLKAVEEALSEPDPNFQFRNLSNEEFDSIYEFGKYISGRAWLLEAFNLTKEVSKLEHIYKHIRRHAAPRGFKRNPDYESRDRLYPKQTSDLDGVD